MNKPLLKRVIAVIEAEPNRLEMRRWMAASHLPACGTIGCIAGWTLLLTERGPCESFSATCARLKDGEIDLDAHVALGISQSEAVQLFYLDQWPHRFWTAHENANTPKERVQVVVQRIRYFMRTGK